MGRPRNIQKSRARRASEILVQSEANELFDDLQQTRDYVKKVATSARMNAFFARAGISGPIDLKIGDGRGRTHYTLQPKDRAAGSWELKLPKNTRGQAQICTILPWLIASPYREIAFDGPEVVAMRIALVKEFMGEGAGAIYREALVKERVQTESDHEWPGGGKGEVKSVELRSYRQSRRRRKPKTGPATWGKPPSPRDAQRARVYNAEDEVWGRATERRLDTMERVRAFVRRVESTTLWRELSSGVGRNQWVNVQDGRGSSRSRAIPEEWTIRIVKQHRNRLVVLHELAHLVTPSRFAAHGPEFTAHYLGLVRRFLGSRTSQRLRHALEKQSASVCNARLQRVQAYAKKAA